MSNIPIPILIKDVFNPLTLKPLLLFSKAISELANLFIATARPTSITASIPITETPFVNCSTSSCANT